MGIIRTLLALSVVFSHCYGYFFVGGKNAVQIFYVISGFLMSYILNEKKGYKSIGKFYLNRFLRIFPVYYFIAILTLIAYIVANNDVFFNVYKSISHTSQAILIAVNALIFGQDGIMFTGIGSNGVMKFFLNFQESEVLTFQGLLIPQAWTLGVELLFYLLIPYIVNKKKLIYLLLSISLVIKIYLSLIGLGIQDPWNYRFFPAELSLFLFGVLSHQIVYKKLKTDYPKTLVKLSKFITLFLIILIVSFSFIPVNESVKSIVLLTIFIILLPFAFEFQKVLAIDKKIGDLSYPIYICHMLVIYSVNGIQSKFSIDLSSFRIMIILLSTIIFAFVIDRYIVMPIESIRSNVKQKLT